MGRQCVEQGQNSACMAVPPCVSFRGCQSTAVTEVSRLNLLLVRLGDLVRACSAHESASRSHSQQQMGLGDLDDVVSAAVEVVALAADGEVAMSAAAHEKRRPGLGEVGAAS